VDSCVGVTVVTVVSLSAFDSKLSPVSVQPGGMHNCIHSIHSCIVYTVYLLTFDLHRHLAPTALMSYGVQSAALISFGGPLWGTQGVVFASLTPTARRFPCGRHPESTDNSCDSHNAKIGCTCQGTATNRHRLSLVSVQPGVLKR